MKRTTLIIESCQRAIVRLLWRSVADGAACTCEGDPARDPCPECEAMRALGYARWIDARDAARCLAAASRALDLCPMCHGDGSKL